MRTDKQAFQAYKEDVTHVIPFFSGFDLHDKSSLDIVKQNLEQGYFGLGEIVAASTQSTVVSKVEWKGNHPMDGFLPQIYDICAEYQVPILLHIDPSAGLPIAKLEEALDSHPKTIFIFGHANAFNSPSNLKRLLEKHSNLYMDFYAGFTAFNPASSYKLEDFVPIIRQFPDRFMLSTDSGYGLVNEEKAIEGMYLLMDKLGDNDLARKIANDNLQAIIDKEPASATQLNAIRNRDKETGKTHDLTGLTKVEAGQILYGQNIK